MLAVTPRRQNILTGAIAMVLLSGAITVGVKGAFGAFDGGYELVGTFDAAGQGLLPGSDVKVRGVDIGQVDAIELVDGQAEVTLRIDADEQVASDAHRRSSGRRRSSARSSSTSTQVRRRERGPSSATATRIVDTQGGFELEQVLADTYPCCRPSTRPSS